MTDTTRTGADFDASYLRTWTEPDAGQRRALIEQMWAPHGSLHISSPALTVTGTADIAEHSQPRPQRPHCGSGPDLQLRPAHGVRRRAIAACQ